MFLCNAYFRCKLCSSREMREISFNVTVHVLSLSVLHVLGKYIFLVKLRLANLIQLLLCCCVSVPKHKLKIPERRGNLASSRALK